MLMKLKQKNNKNNFITWDKKLTATELLGYINGCTFKSSFKWQKLDRCVSKLDLNAVSITS